MRPLRNLVALLFALLLLAVLVLLGAAIAYGAPSAQQTSDETAAWLSQVLMIPIAPRPATLTDVMVSHDADAEATPDGEIHIRASRAPDPFDLTYFLLHETLHATRNAACWGHIVDGVMSPERRTEEGITEALTLDLLPALEYRRFGLRWPRMDTAYEREVRDVRYAVRRMTGGRGWGRPERLALRELWAAGCAAREAMLAEAGR